jgi:hypothetical protein
MKALDDIYKLKQSSVVCLILTIVGFIISLIPGFSFFFYLYFLMSISIVFFSFIGWNNKYAKLNLEVEDVKMVKEKKRDILFLFFCNLVLGISFYIYLFS